MSAYIDQAENNLWILLIRGLLKKSQLDKCQAEYVAKVDEGGKAKLLILLEDFQGWERGAPWVGDDFFFTHGDTITRMAIVGAPRWEVEAMAFVGAGIRKAPVRYFPHSAQIE